MPEVGAQEQDVLVLDKRGAKAVMALVALATDVLLDPVMRQMLAVVRPDELNHCLTTLAMPIEWVEEDHVSPKDIITRLGPEEAATRTSLEIRYVLHTIVGACFRVLAGDRAEEIMRQAEALLKEEEGDVT
jgi:hypothetical protein